MPGVLSQEVQSVMKQSSKAVNLVVPKDGGNLAAKLLMPATQ